MAPSGRPDLEKLSKLADEMVGKRVVVVGDLVADEYIYGEAHRISREAPVLIVRYERSEVRLGGAGNAAANLRSLGAEVTLIGVIGRDDTGQQIRALCADRGIQLVCVTDSALRTETKTRILAGGISTRRQQIVRVDRGSTGELPKDVRRSLVRLIHRHAKDTDAILVSDYGAGVLGPETTAEVRSLRSADRPVCVDSRFQLANWKGVTVAKPNEPELAALAGTSVESKEQLIRAGRAVLARLRVQALLVTRGRNGMALLRRGTAPVFIPPHGTKEAVDVTGAGDTGIAAVTLAVAARGDLLDAAQLANVAAAIVVQKPGAATVSREELLAELSANKNGMSGV